MWWTGVGRVGWRGGGKNGGVDDVPGLVLLGSVYQYC